MIKNIHEAHFGTFVDVFYILLITFSATCGWRVVGDI